MRSHKNLHVDKVKIDYGALVSHLTNGKVDRAAPTLRRANASLYLPFAVVSQAAVHLCCRLVFYFRLCTHQQCSSFLYRMRIILVTNVVVVVVV
jgi:hypothetical protein